MIKKLENIWRSRFLLRNLRCVKSAATSSVKTALKALVDKQLVSKIPTGYLVSDRFFAKWLVRGGIIAN